MVFSGAVFGDSPYRLEKSWLSSVCHISGSTMASHTAFQTSATELMTMLKITARLIRGASLRTPGIELNRLNLLNAIMAHTSATVLSTTPPITKENGPPIPAIIIKVRRFLSSLLGLGAPRGLPPEGPSPLTS